MGAAVRPAGNISACAAFRSRGSGALADFADGSGIDGEGCARLALCKPESRSRQVLTMKIVLPDSKYKTSQQQASFYERVLEQFQAIPGVKAAAVA